MAVLDDIFQSNESMDMKQKIVEELLDSETHLETKTELSFPLKWSCLRMIDEFLGEKKLPNSQTILKEFMNTSFKYLISKERNGRKEYIEALKSLAQMDDKDPTKTLMAGS